MVGCELVRKLYDSHGQVLPQKCNKIHPLRDSPFDDAGCLCLSNPLSEPQPGYKKHTAERNEQASNGTERH